MLVPYRITVEAWGVAGLFTIFIGRSVDEPLPAAFKDNTKYVAGQMSILPGMTSSQEFSYSVDASKGYHYIVVGIQPANFYGLTPPYVFYVKYTVTVAGVSKTIEAVVGQITITEQNVFGQVTFQVTDTGVIVQNYGLIYPGQKPLDTTGTASNISNPFAAMQDTLKYVVQTMMYMMVMMMMMNMMAGMMSTMAAGMR